MSCLTISVPNYLSHLILIIVTSSSYWDWSIDSDDLLESVIWDPVTGFGGDGQGNDTVYIGSCIRDGPFSDYVVSFYNFTYNPHCLSRGIGRDNGQPHKFSGADVTPAAISTVMQEKTFFNFSIALENGPHATIPHLVNGDFFSFEAPNGKTLPKQIGPISFMCQLREMANQSLPTQIHCLYCIMPSWIDSGGSGNELGRDVTQSITDQRNDTPS